jgi:hypothetical protein
MSRHVGMSDLSPGAVVVVDGVEWLVESFAPQYRHIQLRRGDGTTMQTTVRALLTGPASRAPVGATTLGTDAGSRQPVTLADLTRDQRELALLRLAHVLEVETGFRGGDPLRPGPGEPRAGYDPDATTLTARRLAKVAELQALDPQDARRLGFAHVSPAHAGAAGCGLSPVRGRCGDPGQLGTPQRWAVEYHRTGPRGDLRGAGRDAAPVADQHDGAASACLPVRAGEVRLTGAGAVLRDAAAGLAGMVPSRRRPAAPTSIDSPGRRSSAIRWSPARHHPMTPRWPNIGPTGGANGSHR